MSPERRPHARLDPRRLAAARRRFGEIFPGHFRDETYVDWERTYKWQAHQLWCQLLGADELDRLLRRRAFSDVGARAIAIYARPKLNLLALGPHRHPGLHLGHAQRRIRRLAVAMTG